MLRFMLSHLSVVPALASWFSYTALFLLAVGVYAVSALLTFWLKDSRGQAEKGE